MAPTADPGLPDTPASVPSGANGANGAKGAKGAKGAGAASGVNDASRTDDTNGTNRAPGGADAHPPQAAVATAPGAAAALLRLGQALKALDYRFTTVTPATQARVNARPSNAWARSLADVFGWSRPFDAERPPTALSPRLVELMRAAGVLVQDGGAGCRATVRASTLQGQLFFHSAHPTTAADAVFFGPDTCRFAAATLQHLRLRGGAVRRAVDIGCGAGPGAILTALQCPAADVFAVDINAAALRMTTVNAALAGVANVAPRDSNLLAGVDGAFDLIIANPPYLLDAAERAYRHGGGGLGEGLSLAIADAAGARLAPGGSLLLYTGSAIVDGVDRFAQAVQPRLEAAGLAWDYREIDPDVFGEELLEPAYAAADRIAAVLVTATKPT